MRYLRSSKSVLLKGPAIVAGVYLIFSALWVVVTDVMLEKHLGTTHEWQTYKGLLYVLMCTVVLFLLWKRLAHESTGLVGTLAKIFRQSAFGVGISDMDGGILDCNDAYADMFGFSCTELIGKNLRDLAHPESLSAMLSDWHAIFEGGETYVRHRKFLNKSGELVWARLAVSRIDVPPAKAPLILAIVQDVTAEMQSSTLLKEQEAELREMLAAVQKSELRFRKLVESMSSGVLIAAGNGHVIDANDVLLRTIGYSRTELDQGLLKWTELAPTDRELDSIAADEVNSTGRFGPFEKEFLAKDGTKIPVSMSGISIPGITDTDSELVMMITDLRDARSSEAQMSRLVLAVENAHESVMITDLQANIIYVNPAFEALTGYTRTEVLGRNPRILKSGRTSPQDYQEMWNSLKAGESWKGRFWNRHKNGSEYMEDATITPVRNGRGQVINYLAVKRDVTYEHALEVRLNQSQKIEAVGQLAGGVAHDLNNVLQAIQSCSELGLRRVSERQYVQKKLEDILSVSKKGAGIIAQLLAFTRQRAISPSLIDLNEVITDTGNWLRRLLPENMELSLNLAQEVGHVRADRIQLSQVLMNLVVNARDAMPHGGTVTITTTNRKSEDPRNNIRLSVHDTGVGMTEVVKARIFEPFYTTKELGKGTGLGLSTVQEIVFRLGGEISVESAPGLGTTFLVDLPGCDKKSDNETGEPSQSVALSAISNLGCVLMCEDDENVRNAICECLESIGMVVVRCINAAEALKAAESSKPALLISDVVMPGQSGIQLAEELRKMHSDLKVLFISGHSENEILNSVQPGDGIGFLRKPFTAQELIEQLSFLETPSEKKTN